MGFKIGTRVRLRPDVLVRHSRSVPAHLGYTTEQFSWRDTLNKLGAKTGKIQRVFNNSNHINVQFGKTLIGINKQELVPVKAKGNKYLRHSVKYAKGGL